MKRSVAANCGTDEGGPAGTLPSLQRPEAAADGTTNVPVGPWFSRESQSDASGSQAADGSIHDGSREHAPSLSVNLQLLYALNGFSLSLQYMPVMYIINTQIQLPLVYLPTYGVVAFLPWTFKPAYAVLSQQTERSVLLSVLLAVDGTLLLLYAFVPHGTVAPFFLLTFLRSVADAWSEFTVGLCLVDQSIASPRHRFEECVSLFQSQAATGRNLGSLVAASVAFVFFFQRTITGSDGMNKTAAITLLAVTASCHIGAALAIAFQHVSLGRPVPASNATFELIPVHEHSSSDSSQQPNTHRVHTATSPSIPFHLIMNTPATPDERSDLRDNRSESSYSSTDDSIESGNPSSVTPPDSSSPVRSLPSSVDDFLQEDSTVQSVRSRYCLEGNIVPGALLQAAVVVFALKEPVSNLASEAIWKTTVVGLVIALMVSAVVLRVTDRWQAKLHGTALFLVIRHITPSDGILMSSFLYTAFASAPLYLQIHALAISAARALSSWSYQNYVSKHSKGNGLLVVIVSTTVLASAVSLANVILVRQVRQNVVQKDITDTDGWSGETDAVFVGDFRILTWMTALTVGVLTAFVEEWSFLPDVILATSSVTISDDMGTDIPGDGTGTGEDANVGRSSRRRLAPSQADGPDQGTADVEYGTLISCIDFGDQVGALLTGPLVGALGVSRESGWENFDTMIVLCSVLGLVPLCFLGLLPKERKERR